MRRRSAASWGVSKAWGGGTAARDSAASGIVAAAKPDATMVRRLSAGAPSLLCRLPTDFDPCGFASLEFRRNGRACSSRQLRSIAAPHQNLALAHVVGRADDALSFHPFDDSRGAIVANLEMALHKAGRRLTLPTYYGDCLCIERVAQTALLLASRQTEGRVVILGDRIDVVGLGARLQE